MRPRPRFQVAVTQVAGSFIKSVPMNKYKETFGVDISKNVFDVFGSSSGHNQFNNDEKGFKSFLKILSNDSIVAMEATGYYHYRLAQFLYKNNVAVSVVNPLSVKRFIQMKLTLALIAVANKLLKQCFAIAKSGLPYDANFVSVLAEK